jgi:hypothetical protein
MRLHGLGPLFNDAPTLLLLRQFKALLPPPAIKSGLKYGLFVVSAYPNLLWSRFSSLLIRPPTNPKNWIC